MTEEQVFKRLLEILGQLAVGLGASVIAIVCIVTTAGVFISYDRSKKMKPEARPAQRKKQNWFAVAAVLSGICLYLFISKFY